jgi:hypothetical protein
MMLIKCFCVECGGELPHAGSNSEGELLARPSCACYQKLQVDLVNARAIADAQRTIVVEAMMESDRLRALLAEVLDCSTHTYGDDQHYYVVMPRELWDRLSGHSDR